MVTTVRRCKKCNYEKVILEDDLKDKFCRKPFCSGLMEIIYSEK